MPCTSPDFTACRDIWEHINNNDLIIMTFILFTVLGHLSQQYLFSINDKKTKLLFLLELQTTREVYTSQRYRVQI